MIIFWINVITINILSTIKRCDVIYVMEKGKIVEVGNHEQLIEFDDGMYAKLWGSKCNKNAYF